MFAWDVHHFQDVAALAAYLDTLGRITWYSGVTIHHTAIPTVQQWRGRASMERLGVYYRDEVKNPDGSKGWSAGPNFFIGPDGIWVGTPPNRPGIHAVSFNGTHIGMEVVGNYDAHGWLEPIRSYAYDTIELLLRRRGLSVQAVNGHRDDRKTDKSCPGRAIDLNAVRRELSWRLATKLYRVRADGSRIRQRPSTSSAVLEQRNAGALVRGTEVSGETHAGSNRWVQLARGYMWRGLLEPAA
jgi:hypothetical protein